MINDDSFIPTREQLDIMLFTNKAIQPSAGVSMMVKHMDQFWIDDPSRDTLEFQLDQDDHVNVARIYVAIRHIKQGREARIAER